MNYTLAELRCYEKTNHGIEVSDCLSYVFVENVGRLPEREYQNAFTDEKYPIVLTSNIGKHDSYYFEKDNSIIFDEYGEVGLCYRLINITVSNLPIDDIKHIIIYSDKYFKDRKDLMEEFYEGDLNSSMRRTLYDDLRRYEDLREYLDEKGISLGNGGKKLVR